MEKVARLSIVVLLVVLALAAMGGGWLLIDDPSGVSIQIPIDFLSGTPFKDYLIPGIILFIFIGAFSLFTAILTVLNRKIYSKMAVLEGILLIGWLSIELFLNSDFYAPTLHLPLYAIGVLLIVMGVKIIRIKDEETRSATFTKPN
ncbi:MAG: hypothetical protein MUO53_16000 [Maribacter sp.]|nr:hypothetical protein [Maribacter sp.]